MQTPLTTRWSFSEGFSSALSGDLNVSHQLKKRWKRYITNIEKLILSNCPSYCFTIFFKSTMVVILQFSILTFLPPFLWSALFIWGKKAFNLSQSFLLTREILGDRFRSNGIKILHWLLKKNLGESSQKSFMKSSLGSNYCYCYIET